MIRTERRRPENMSDVFLQELGANPLISWRAFAAAVTPFRAAGIMFIGL
jgi:hypothetical protein